MVNILVSSPDREVRVRARLARSLHCVLWQGGRGGRVPAMAAHPGAVVMLLVNFMLQKPV